MKGENETDPEKQEFDPYQTSLPQIKSNYLYENVPLRTAAL